MDTMYDCRPERSKPKIVDCCNECGYDIYEGEEHYDINNLILCKDCMEEFKRSGEEE